MKRWLPPLAWAVAIFAASSIPGDSMPAPGLFRYDKLIHAAVFAVLGALCQRAGRRLPLSFALATGYGALDELHQRYTPNRSPEVADVVADGLGALVGAAAMMWAGSRKR